MNGVNIIIPQNKRYLLSMLYDKFPLFAVDLTQAALPIPFIASLEDGADYTADLAWLQSVGLVVLTADLEREEVLKGLFKGALLAGMTITNVRFQQAETTHPEHFLVVLTLQNVTDLTLHVTSTWWPSLQME